MISKLIEHAEHRYRHTILYLLLAIVLLASLLWSLMFSKTILKEQQSVGGVVGTSMTTEGLDSGTVFQYSDRINTTHETVITEEDRQAVFKALESGYKIMTSKNPSLIRNHLKDRATTAAEARIADTSTDSDLITLSERVAAISHIPKISDITAKDAVWVRDGYNITITFTDSYKNSTATLHLVNKDGNWI